MSVINFVTNISKYLFHRSELILLAHNRQFFETIFQFWSIDFLKSPIKFRATINQPNTQSRPIGNRDRRFTIGQPSRLQRLRQTTHLRTQSRKQKAKAGLGRTTHHEGHSEQNRLFIAHHSVRIGIWFGKQKPKPMFRGLFQMLI